jgi:putative peptide zinc metalloprotease protein
MVAVSASAAAPAEPPGISALQLRPRLKAHVDFYRHIYRDEVWYVFHDRAVDRFYRVSGPGADLIGALDGQRTLGEICADFQARQPDDPIDTQLAGEFLAQINALGLLRTGISPSAEAIERKQNAIRRRRILSGLKSPLAIRIPLFDPTCLLDRLAPVGTLVFSRIGALVWCVVVLTGLVVGVRNWGDLSADFSDRLLSLGNLGVVGLIYPFVKAVHELAHGMALRRYGVEMRRMGLIFVAFMPMPYVDASSSVLLRSKHARMLVAGAGILVELFIAALAMLGWTHSVDGTFHVICYNTLLLTGLSTLLFNGNPLQRYDGYYILCDLAEIPSLGVRSTQYVYYLMRRHLLADGKARAPAASESEKRWFVTYGVMSALYRIWLVLSIGLFVARTYPLLGAGLALWSILGMLWGPVAGLVNLAAGRTGLRREKSLIRLGGVLGVSLLLLFALPLPLRLVAEGVVWLPDAANVRANVSGEIDRIAVTPGQRVEPGQPVVVLRNATLQTSLIRARAALEELEAEHVRQSGRARFVDAGNVADSIVAARQRLAEVERDVTSLTVRSATAGTIMFADYAGLNGRFLPKGQAPAVVWNGDAVVIRTLVPLEEIDRLRDRITTVRIRPGYDSATTFRGHLLRIVPSATQWLPSMVLSVEGGGHIPVMDAGHQTHLTDSQLDVVQPTQARLAAPLFEIDVACDDTFPFPFLNGRALVRFDLGTESLGMRLVRWARLTFMRDLHA